MKKLKICLIILCLLSFRIGGLPQFNGAKFFMENEEWIDIKGYEGRYQISNFGRVKALSHISYFTHYKGERLSFVRKEYIKKEGRNKAGYSIMALCINGNQRHFSVHKLVCCAFIPNPMNYPQINHKNGVKNDNRVSNLEWCTAKYNAIHAIENGLRKNYRNQYSKPK